MNYAKGSTEVINECEKALMSIVKCQFQDCKCAPNDSDFDLVRKALWTIAEYKQLRNIK